MKTCKGCHREMINACSLYYKYDQATEPTSCPCMICLVKGVCNQTCEDRQKFWNIGYDRIWMKNNEGTSERIKTNG